MGRTDYDPRARFRLWIDGKLIDEAWVDVSNPDVNTHAEAIRERHRVLVEAAEAHGGVWMVETYDPALPTEVAHVRIGTDRAGMRDPRPL